MSKKTSVKLDEWVVKHSLIVCSLFATFVNESGEFITLELHEELSAGLKLVEINIKEAVFQKADNGYISLNFKNQIRERDEF